MEDWILEKQRCKILFKEDERSIKVKILIFTLIEVVFLILIATIDILFIVFFLALLIGVRLLIFQYNDTISILKSNDNLYMIIHEYYDEQPDTILQIELDDMLKHKYIARISGAFLYNSEWESFKIQVPSYQAYDVANSLVEHGVMERQFGFGTMRLKHYQKEN